MRIISWNVNGMAARKDADKSAKIGKVLKSPFADCEARLLKEPDVSTYRGEEIE